MKIGDKLSSRCIEAAIQDSRFWRRLVYRDQIGSTNDAAKELASQGEPEGALVVAEEQTAGRGRLSRRWIAPARSSLLCSILFRPSLSPQQAHRLTMLCSLAAADAVEEVSGLSVAVKWPNDLVIVSSKAGSASEDWRKLGGILTELEMAGGCVDSVVVGIGLNVNVPPSSLQKLAPDATSILAELGHMADRSTLLIALLDNVQIRYENLRNGLSPCKEWSARLVTLGQRVRLVTSGGTLHGVAEAVDENGALLLRTADGVLHRLLTGDATLSRS